MRNRTSDLGIAMAIILILAVLAFVLSLQGCAPADYYDTGSQYTVTNVQKSNSNQNLSDYKIINVFTNVVRIVDFEAGYVCYVNDEGGIWCDRMTLTQQGELGQ